MKIGMVGLGKMGANMAVRLMTGGHECVVNDMNPKKISFVVEKGAVAAASLEDLVAKLPVPRVVWVMVPSGGTTENTVAALGSLLSAGDTVIDGGNTYYKDDVRRAKMLKEKGIRYVDVGTSGGILGAKNGYCLMVGSDKQDFENLIPIFKSLSPGLGEIARTPHSENFDSHAEEGFFHCGPVGAGHFVKMVHNGIEYGMMEALAEGFDLLKNADSPQVEEEFRYNFDLTHIAEVWRRGSVISSGLLDLIAIALERNPTLSDFTGFVSDSGEGRWTLQTAVEQAVPTPVLAAALFNRFRSRQNHTFGEKMISAMRKGFGGHNEPDPHNEVLLEGN